MAARQLKRWELDGVDGPVVVIDVIRAFTTAAYAFGAGATAVYLVATVEEALAFEAARRDVLAMGEDRGRRPTGFDFSNSPVAVSRADLDERTLVQRTSAGTQGVVAAVDATRLWAASLVCASATARAVNASGLGEPSYVITVCFPDRPDDTGDDDRLTADLIERARSGRPVNVAEAAEELHATGEASRTLALGPEHCDPLDIEYASPSRSLRLRDGGHDRHPRPPPRTQVEHSETRVRQRSPHCARSPMRSAMCAVTRWT